MIEIKTNEIDKIDKRVSAMKKLGFSQKEIDNFWKYTNLLYGAVSEFLMDERNKGKDINAGEILDLARKDYSEGEKLANRVLEYIS